MNLQAQPARLSTLDASFEADFNARLHWSAEADAAIEERVAAILADVQQRGDAAVLDYTQRFDGLKADSVAALEITQAELQAALAAIHGVETDANLHLTVLRVLDRVRHQVADDLAQARTHAQQCLEIVATNDGAALERFFGWEALGRVERAAGNATGHAQALAQAEQAFAGLEEGDRGWCQASLDALKSTTA